MAHISVLEPVAVSLGASLGGLLGKAQQACKAVGLRSLRKTDNNGFAFKRRFAGSRRP